MAQDHLQYWKLKVGILREKDDYPGISYVTEKAVTCQCKRKIFGDKGFRECINSISHLSKITKKNFLKNREENAEEDEEEKEQMVSKKTGHISYR